MRRGAQLLSTPSPGEPSGDPVRRCDADTNHARSPARPLPLPLAYAPPRPTRYRQRCSLLTGQKVRRRVWQVRFGTIKRRAAPPAAPPTAPPAASPVVPAVVPRTALPTALPVAPCPPHGRPRPVSPPLPHRRKERRYEPPPQCLRHNASDLPRSRATADRWRACLCLRAGIMSEGQWWATLLGRAACASCAVPVAAP